ncbi:hypothetical protein P262_p2107 (plasmid) [Cronobacter malonaticus]|uniref:Uncharacterized protein n=1 Tax=Cronobacter malonaticus TaxID=413503 RepID=V5U580_9ENTR|nr:hypothetical protein P262_p2107 [Cronobacter malonaticus]
MFTTQGFVVRRTQVNRVRAFAGRGMDATVAPVGAGDQIIIHAGLFLWRPGVVLCNACVIILHRLPACFWAP